MVQIRRKSFTGMLIACGLILLGAFISTTYNIDQITMFKWFGTFCLLIGLLPILLIILIPLWSYLMDSMDRLSVIINDRYSKSERFSILEKKLEKSKDKYRKKELIKSFTQKETLTLLNLTRLIHVSNLVDDEFWISLFISQISELEMTRRNCEYYGLFIKELKSDESRLKLKNSLASKGIKFDENFYIRMDNREQKNRILKS
jgi:hypothetical protein